jgi:hypothetical protein
MHIDLRKLFPHGAEHFLVPLQRQFGMQTALQQNLIATQRDGFLNLLKQRFNGKHVDFRMVRRAIEGTEITNRRTGVGVLIFRSML